MPRTLLAIETATEACSVALVSGETLVLRVDDDDEREALLAAQPHVFFVTDHYRGHPMLLVRLPRVRPALLRELVEKTWRRHAGKRAHAPNAPAPRKRA